MTRRSFTAAGLAVTVFALAGGLLVVRAAPRDDPPPEPARPQVELPRATIIEGKAEPFDATKFVNPPGWKWLMRPKALKIGDKGGASKVSFSKDGQPDTSSRMFMYYSHIDADDGSLKIFLVQASAADSLGPPEHRLVVLDADGKRYNPKFVNNMGGGAVKSGDCWTHLGHVILRLDSKTLDPKKATHVGIEEIVRKKRDQ